MKWAYLIDDFKFILNNTKKIFLYSHGRSASVFLHSLFDSHKEIITIPIVFNSYHHYSLCKDMSAEKAVNYLIFNSQLRPIFNKEKTKVYGNFQNIKINTSIFKHTFKYLWPQMNSPEKFFYALNLCYEKSTENRNTKKIKAILEHTHDLELDLKNFNKKKNSRSQFIFTIREPLPNFSSIIKKKKKRHKLFFDIVMLQLMKKKLIETIIILKNIDIGILVKMEDLHSKNKKLLEEITKKLNISFQDTLLKSTISGQDFYYEDSEKKILGFQKKINNAIDFSFEELKFANNFLKPAYYAFDYKFPNIKQTKTSTKNSKKKINIFYYIYADYMFIYNRVKYNKNSFVKKKLLILKFMKLLPFALLLKKYIDLLKINLHKKLFLDKLNELKNQVNFLAKKK